MATTNQRLLDATIDHSISLIRYANGVVRRISALMNRVDADLFNQLSNSLQSLPPEAFTVERLEQFLVSVRNINAQAYAQLERQMGKEVHAMVEYEASFQQNLLNRAIPTQVLATIGTNEVEVEQVYSAVMSRPFQGRLLNEWARSMGDQRMLRIRDTLRQGYVEQQSVSQMITRLRGTRASGYSDGIVSIDKRNAEAVVRTAIGHTAQYTRQQVYNENTDLIQAVEWVSTLDNRTTPPCMLRDRKLYSADARHEPIDHSYPWGGGPGAFHWNCRSTSAPVVKTWKQLGLNTSEFSGTTRAAMDGAVATDTTYSQWLRRQSAQRQDEILGATRGALFRQGAMPLEAFANDKGKWLTLNQLRAQDNAVLHDMTDRQRAILGLPRVMSEAELASLRKTAETELQKLGMEGQPITYTVGGGMGSVPLEGEWTAVAQFSGKGKLGTISVDLSLIESHSMLRNIVRHEAQHARFNYARARAETFIEKNLAALRAEDGTTAYSKAYWAKYEEIAKFEEKFAEGTTKGSDLYWSRQLDAIRQGEYQSVWHAWKAANLATNESLSEMHAYEQTLPPTYAKLNKIVDAAWKKKTQKP